jgi:integrase/recombinase XerC
MASETTSPAPPQRPESTAENTTPVVLWRRGDPALELPEAFAAVLEAYVVALAAAPLAAHTRRTYASKVRQYLAWLALAETDGDPLNTADGLDWAVRDDAAWHTSASPRSS